MKRQTLKPSFLDIGFDDDGDEPDLSPVGRHESKLSVASNAGSAATVRGMSPIGADPLRRLKRESTSFLDLERGSMESTRE